MRAMGVPQSEIDRLREEENADASDEFGIAPENWQSFRVFNALGTQWRIVAGFGGAYYEGLDYGVIPQTMKLMGVKRKKRSGVFNDLRIMEAEAQKILNAAP